jgi:GT2 family glycosyltransferase
MSSVMVSYLHRNTVSHSFMESLMSAVNHDRSGPNVIRYVVPVYSGPVTIPESRNMAVKALLDNSDAEWLWMVDSDMGFGPDALHRLLESADAGERPVVGALCMGTQQTASDGMGGWHIRAFPTLYDWGADVSGVEGFIERATVERGGVARVDGTGAACLLAHRSVLEKLRAEGDGWFDQVRYGDGTLVSEDLSFCFRLRRLGVPLYVDTRVRTSHHKSVWITPEG